MIIGSNFVFIHNPMSAGAFIRNLLECAYPNSEFLPLHKWHTPISELDIKHWQKFKFGNVKNPWAWYYSLYNKSKKYNGTYHRLIDPNKELNFIDFMKKLLSQNTLKKYKAHTVHPVGNTKSPNKIPHFKYMNSLHIGLYSYQYIYLYCKDYEDIFNKQINIFNNPDKYISVNKVLTTENIVDDLINSFGKNGIIISENYKKMWRNTSRKNVTTGNVDYTKFYDLELKKMIEEKDRLLIQYHNFKF